MKTLEAQEAKLRARYDKTHTDRVDVSFNISLFEYGVVRNPETNETIFSVTAGIDAGIEIYKHEILIYDITIDDVRDDLEDMPSGYFALIGSTIEQELELLDNKYLSIHIKSMQQYDGRYI